MSNHRTRADGNVGDVIIWSIAPILLIGLCVQDGDWVTVAIVCTFLITFGTFVLWLWLRTVRMERADEARDLAAAPETEQEVPQ